MRFDTLQDWLLWQQTSHSSDIDLGLQRVGQVASRMGLNLANSQVVTVAGTNGKGSCVATLNALLLSAGQRVGCFTSPHFSHYSERIVINNQPVSEQLIIEAFDRIDRARDTISLSYFEFGTLAALDIFQRSELDVVLLEVGLGGRLDAVNIIDADFAIVTSIDIDHQQWLGTDREQIGREKAGIFRAGKIAISAGHQPPASLKQHADSLPTQLLQAGVDFDDLTLADSQGWCWRGINARGEPVEIGDLPAVQLPRESVSAAIQLIQLMELPANSVDFQSLATLTLPGRFQPLTLSGKQLVLDVAHNPAAASYLAEKIQQRGGAGRRFALMAVMQDKDVAAMITALAASFDGWFAAPLPEVPRAMSAQQLGATIRQQGVTAVQVCDSVEQGLSQCLAAMNDEDCLFVLGSFFTVAEVLNIHRSAVCK
jgi:dihydrofolate synthase/folylpolyglutamate synthase